MANILSVFLMPHPPILVPEVGKGREKKIQKTLDALNYCSMAIMNKAPETVVLLTPHGHLLNNGIPLLAKKKLEGNLSRFGAPMISASFENDMVLTNEIISQANTSGISCFGLDDELALECGVSTSLDWGAMVPLYFLTRHYIDFKLVHITIPRLDNDKLYKFGMAIQKAVKACRHFNNAVVICSGDLSHCLTHNGPYGFHPMGPKLDEKILKLLSEKDVRGLFALEHTMIEKGKECGLRTIIAGMGVLDGCSFNSRVLSYEGPFGVGYAVAEFEPLAARPLKSTLDKLHMHEFEHVEASEQTEDIYVSLARQALEHYVKTRRMLMPDFNDLPSDLQNRRAGVFVSIKKNGQLRGCIGTAKADKKNVAEEIIYNAVSAGTKDPRFPAVSESEFKHLSYSVDILGQTQPVESIEQLDAKKLGVIVKCGRRTGLLLPDIEGVATPQEQIDIALRKAGIDDAEHYTIECFEVERHK